MFKDSQAVVTKNGNTIFTGRAPRFNFIKNSCSNRFSSLNKIRDQEEEREVSAIPVCRGGLVILGSSYQEYTIYDLLNGRQFSLESDEPLELSQLNDYMNLPLPAKTLLKIMGKQQLGEFLRERQLYLKKWRKFNL